MVNLFANHNSATTYKIESCIKFHKNFLGSGLLNISDSESMLLDCNVQLCILIDWQQAVIDVNNRDLCRARPSLTYIEFRGTLKSIYCTVSKGYIPSSLWYQQCNFVSFLSAYSSTNNRNNKSWWYCYTHKMSCIFHVWHVNCCTHHNLQGWFLPTQCIFLQIWKPFFKRPFVGAFGTVFI